MRVKVGQHASDGRLHQILISDFLNIFGANPFKYVCEKLELVVSIICLLKLRSESSDGGTNTNAVATKAPTNAALDQNFV